MSKTRLMKKLSSVILIMAMLVTMFSAFGVTSVSAATLTKTTLYDWYAHQTGNAEGTLSRDTAIKHSGNASLNINMTSGTFYLSNAYADMALEKDAKYKFEFYAKITTQGSKNSLIYDSADGTKQTSIFGAGFTNEPETSTGWTKYYRDLTMGDNPEFYIDFTGAMNINLDDMALYKYDGATPDTSNNLLKNGDFEAETSTDNGTGTAIDGYTVGYDWGGKYIPNKLYAETNTTDATGIRTGNGSLKVVRTAYANNVPSASLKITTNTITPASGSTYRLTYYIKTDGDVTHKNGTPSATSRTKGISWNWGGVTKNVSSADVFAETADNDHSGWTKMETDITTTSTGNTLEFRVIGHFVGYIDDISIYKLEGDTPTGNNLVEYGTFDYVVPDPMEYEPKNVLLISGHDDGGVLNISWRNPKKTTLNKVALYKITSGAPEVVSTTLDTTPNASVEYVIGGLNASDRYTYKILFEFSDGEKREVIASAIPFAYDNSAANKKDKLSLGTGTDAKWTQVAVPYSDWSGNKKWVLPTNMTIETTEGYNGESTKALHIQTNKDADAVRTDAEQTMANYWTRLDNGSINANLEKAKYRIKFRMKNTNVTLDTGDKNVARRVYLGGKDDYIAKTSRYPETTDGWIQYIVDRDLSGVGSVAGGLRMYFASDDIEDMWLDDFEIYKLDASGNETGNNLFAEFCPDFETYTAANSVTEQSATAGNRSVTINYTAPSDSRYVRIYEKGVHEGSDQWYLRAIAEPTATGVTLEGLKNGSEYTYKIESQSVYGVYSDPVTVSAAPSAPPYEVEGDYDLKLGSTPATAVTGNGTYTVSLDVTNYTTDNFKPALIVALYKDDILVGFSKDDDYTFIKTDDGDNQTLSADVTVENYDSAAKYEICTFLWDTFENLSPLYKSKSWDNQ